jgi:tetratricopeptide (TPR) repeat protein
MALALGQWEEAYQQFRKSIQALAQEHRAWRVWSLAYAQAGLGRALIGLGKFSEAREILLEAIHNAPESNAWDLIFLPLLGSVSLFAALGKSERAIELAAFIVSQRLSWNETKRQAREVIESASRNLPEEVAQAAQERGQAMNMDQAIALALQED